MNNVYEEYAAIDAEIKALESKKEQMRPEIIKGMLEDGIDKLETALGKFTITPLKKWVYPESVLDLGEKFKAAQAKAQSTGEASFEEQPSLRFTPSKL